MTKEQLIAKVRELATNSEFIGFVENLYGRWLDEREYEDFADYAEAMKKRIPDGFDFVKATKRPFGFQFKVDGDASLFAMTMTTTKWSIKRLA